MIKKENVLKARYFSDVLHASPRSSPTRQPNTTHRWYIRYSMSPFELLTLGPGPPLNSSIYAQNQSSILPDHTFENRFRCEEKLWLPLVQTIEDEVTGYRSSRKRLRKEIEKLGRNI